MSRRNQHSWKDDLRPFASIWWRHYDNQANKVDEYEAVREMQLLVEMLNETAIARLRVSITKPTQTNCWFASFQAAAMLTTVINPEEPTTDG